MNAKRTEIRRIKFRECQMVAEFSAEAATERPFRYGRRFALKHLRRVLESFFKRKENLVLVAEKCGIAVGVVAATPIRKFLSNAEKLRNRSVGNRKTLEPALRMRAESVFYVELLMVKRGHRKTGIATALMKRIEARARRRGFRAVCVRTHPDSKAFPLFLELGYAEILRETDVKKKSPRAYFLKRLA